MQRREGVKFGHCTGLACMLALALSGCGSGGGGGESPSPERAVSPPPRATELSAEAGDGEVTLSWARIVAATRWDYRQRVGNGAWGAWAAVPDSGSSTTGHKVTALENGTTYGFQVRALNAGGAGPPSGEATATLAPPAPAGLATTAGDGLVELTWTAMATATGWEYRTRADDGAWGEWTAVPDSGPETTGHTVSDLENGAAYGFQVRALNAGGAGPPSGEATATLAPPAPAGLAATAGDGLVELTWTAMATATGWEYRTRAGDGAWGGWTAVPDSGPDTTGHTVTGLENGAAYGFQVRALNAGGAGPPSGEATATLAPPAPADLAATAGDGLVELTWTAMATATGWEYRMRARGGAWGEWTEVPDGGPESAAHTVANVKRGRAYGFQVRALNAGGAGPASGEATATLAPPAPADLAAAAGDGLVELTWTAMATATGWQYRTRAGDGAWGGWTAVPDSGPETTGHTVSGLENGAAYGFQVRALNAGGAGPPSGEATATLAPPAPAGLAAAAGDGLVELTWTALGTATGWEYRTRTGDGAWGGWTAVPDSGPETTGHTVSGLENGAAYGFQVRALNAGGAGPPSGEATATLAPPAPAGLAAAAGDGLVELTWTALGTATGWEYRTRTGDGAWGGWTAVPDSGPETTGHTVSGLENGAAYGFQVRALNAGGAGPPSEEAKATPVASAIPVEIPDENLRRVLEDRFGKAPGEAITDANMRRLYQVSATRKGITDLTGLEYATNLGRGIFARNSIADLTPLESLKRLWYLDLSENRVADLSPLRGLASLEHLSLWDNDVVELTPLSGLERLKRLELGPDDPDDLAHRGEASNRVSDLSPLSTLLSLTHLELSHNEVSDLTPLAGLTSLEHLGLTYNYVADLEPVSRLASLARLELGGNRAWDLKPLSTLAALTHLELWLNAVADISPLAGLTSLQFLDLADNEVVDLQPIADLASLTHLNVGSNRIANISAVGGLRSLQELYLGANPVSDLEPLAALASLRRLDLRSLRAVDDLTFVSRMEDLEYLLLGHTPVRDLYPLSSLSKLETLEISDTAVDDLSPLENLAALRRLNMLGLSVNLEPLAGLTALEQIAQLGWLIDGVRPKVDIAPLAGLTNLEDLTASPVYGNLSPLAGLVSLRRLSLFEPGTPFENLDALEPLSLQSLRMVRGDLDRIPPVAWARLSNLHLLGNRIEDLAPLAEATSLWLLSLSNNRVVDVGNLVANPGLGDGDSIWLEGNPLGPDALQTHIPELESRGVKVTYTRDDFHYSPLRILEDEAVSMRVDADLDTVLLDLDLVAEYAREFLANFGDHFDVLIFVSALPHLTSHANPQYSGRYLRVSNDVDGIGVDPVEEPTFGSTRLKGVIHFHHLRALAYGPSLHELMHMWANYGVETSYDVHWGFSSAAGQLGGFRLADLVDLGDGRWTAGSFGEYANGGNGLPYSPWELYLGGFVGPDAVPDLWVAPEGRWTGERTEAGLPIFEALEHSTLSIEDFVEKHGLRVPNHIDAPKELRGAVIVLEDDDYRLDDWDDLLEQVRWLSHPGPHPGFRPLYNYHEATGGRGSLVLDGLRDLRLETPSAAPLLRLELVCPAPGMAAGAGAGPLGTPWMDVRRPPLDFRGSLGPEPGR